jgi:hypothetical protein
MNGVCSYRMHHNNATCLRDVLPVSAGIYQKQPTITEGLSHEQLLQLMLLADRFEVPKVQAAVATAFSGVQPQQLEWQTSLQLLDLPPSCSQQPEFKAVQQLAVQRLQQQLGDLEEVWADKQLQQQLLSLPFPALLQLLQHADTRVATENTVVYTIEEWYSAQAATAQVEEQLQQLMHLVRVRHCTPFYAGTVMPQSSLVQICFDRSELLLVPVCCTPTEYPMLLECGIPALKKYPSWGAEKRPVSAKQPVIEWRLPLERVEAAVKDHLSGSSEHTSLATSTMHVVRGQPAALIAEVSGSSSSSNAATPLKLGMFLPLEDLPRNVVRKVSARFSCEEVRGVTAAGRREVPTTGYSRAFRDIFLSEEQTRGFSCLVDLGTLGSWEAAEAALRQKQLVHAGGQGDGAVGPHLLVKVELLELL